MKETKSHTNKQTNTPIHVHCNEKKNFRAKNSKTIDRV
jgi:hypothetical protein